MRIAVCDDQEEVREHVYRILNRIKRKEDSISKHSDGTSLLEDFIAGRGYDLIFLDIEMPNKNGRDVARKLMKIAPDAVIVILTRFRDFAIEFYKYRVRLYLIKPATETSLREVLDDARPMIDRGRRTVLLKTRDGFIQQQIQTIRYLSIEGRNLVAHTTDDNFEFYGSIQEITASLGDAFYQIHQSYSVNMFYVKKTPRYTALMDSGEALPISEKRYKNFLRTFTDYIDSRCIVRCY